MNSILPNLILLTPELILICGAFVLLMLGAFAGEKIAPLVEKSGVAIFIASAISVLWLVQNDYAGQTAFNSHFMFDQFAAFLKFVCLAGCAVTLAMVSSYFNHEDGRRFEVPVLMLLCATGMSVMISSQDLITLYIGLELQSLAAYVLASIRRDHLRTTEAGLKYFVLGALSSGMFLYGASLLYGFTGTTTFEGIASVLTGGPLSIERIFGLVFLMVGIAFKLSAVPFHMWAPDVYEGAPTPITAFIAGAMKVAAAAMIVRVLFDAFPTITPAWQQIVTFLSIASMLLGAFAAIGQTNIKRLLAYSSISNIGFVLLGLAGANEEGVRAVLLYMVIYLIMTLGSFALVQMMRTKEGQVESIENLSGLARTQPMIAFLFAMLMFSLAGIPPLAGFFAKYFVLMAAVKANLFPLAVIGVLASVVGAYYYLRVVKIMYFDEPKTEFLSPPATLNIILSLSGLFVLLYIVYPAPLVAAATAAARSLF